MKDPRPLRSRTDTEVEKPWEEQKDGIEREKKTGGIEVPVSDRQHRVWKYLAVEDNGVDQKSFVGEAKDDQHETKESRAGDGDNAEEDLEMGEEEEYDAEDDVEDSDGKKAMDRRDAAPWAEVERADKDKKPAHDINMHYTVRNDGIVEYPQHRVQINYT